MSDSRLYVGIDLGTSGCRAIAINTAGGICGQAAVDLPAPQRHGAGVEQQPALWWQAVRMVLHTLLREISPHAIHAIAIDGTSGTLLLADQHGAPLAPALLYNDARSLTEAEQIARLAPPASAAHGPSGGLAKLLYLQKHVGADARFALSQADWIGAQFTGHYGISDEHNCLKLGYDPVARCWPDWLDELGVRRPLLPRVVAAGTPLAAIHADIAREFKLSTNTLLVAGTTDSTAAFIASGANTLGDAVTSLGSTLVVKILSAQPIFAPHYGVYSHRYGKDWIVGGGSNSGGVVLRHYFTDQQLARMTPLLKPSAPTGLDYYPLLTPGERFPINDPILAPRLTPRPADDVQFLQGLLEGMARIEHRAYQLLMELGAPYPSSIRTVGGGAVNTAWEKIRASFLQVPLIKPSHGEAAYGAALLARQATRQS